MFAGQSRLEKMYFDEATILGAEQHLPDGLFKGLTSLASFSCEKCGLQKLPNMDDLTALKQFNAYGNQVGGATASLFVQWGAHRLCRLDRRYAETA